MREHEAEAEEKAIAFRDRHGLGIAPIKDLVALAEEYMGLDLVFEELPVGIDALTTKDPEKGKVFVAVAVTANVERQRFTIAHEIAHIEFDDLVEGFSPHPVNPVLEDRAHSFARHLLIPHSGIEHRLIESGAKPMKLQLEHLSLLIQYFGVSPTVVSIQLLEGSWISQETFDEWTEQDAGRLSLRYGWEVQRNAARAISSQKRPSQRLASRAIELYRRGLVPISLVASVRGRSIDETKNDMIAAGIFPENVTADETSGDLGFVDEL
ncbi:ImmA/IrrE family metallo-endopeptidase [Subtercola frigoramans]|uniref:Zn-dependent peptidase ImmA (M78 family) n=1 Tax=Subtercola frigoramans TaxID=120298 RepID=A0ABS2L294_9MICO|nr:ImmA/IrrE family metallo-endopeptidase [Subtercola frigoramans]MBM7471168.1 Zn-dependent peptidase ImmA (M78 family) [Subtercola frigoramans]